MSLTMRRRFQAAILLIAPAVLLAGFIAHPFIGLGPPNETAIAAAVTAYPTRWGLSHLTVAVGSGLLVLAFLAIRGYLRDAGEEVWSTLGFLFIVIGSTLFAVLPGMEFAPLAASATGGDVQAAQAALFPWFVPILMTGAVIFALGILGFQKGIADSGVLSQRLTWVVIAALAVMAVARFVPLAAVQLYLQGVAGIVALWPMAYQMWKLPQGKPAQQPRPHHALHQNLLR